jgi:hypothetical protein
MKTNIKVTVEYVGAFSATNAQEYRIKKIVGAPTVEAQLKTNAAAYKVMRVGDIISEAQATEMATRVELTTLKA